jgi:hypothetical protein
MTTPRVTPGLGSLRHAVLFQWKDDTTPEQLAAVEQTFAELPGKIPEILAFEWGTDVSVEGKSGGFTHLFFVTFADEAGRASYLPHPAHEHFKNLVGPCVEKVLVLDYVART